MLVLLVTLALFLPSWSSLTKRSRNREVSSGQWSSTRSDRRSRANDVSMRLPEVNSRGQSTRGNMARKLQSSGLFQLSHLRRKRLRQSYVTCNDGSHAGYI